MHYTHLLSGMIRSNAQHWKLLRFIIPDKAKRHLRLAVTYRSILNKLDK